MNTNLAPIDELLVGDSVTNIHRVARVIPVLLELSRFIQGWHSEDEGRHPTKQWCDSLFNVTTQDELETTIELLARLANQEAHDVANRLDVGDF